MDLRLILDNFLSLDASDNVVTFLMGHQQQWPGQKRMSREDMWILRLFLKTCESPPEVPTNSQEGF